MDGTCKSLWGLPLSEEPSGEQGMGELKSCLLGRYLFFWPPQPRRVVVTSLKPGSGCSNKVRRFGFLAGQEGVIDQCHESFPPSSRPQRGCKEYQKRWEGKQSSERCSGQEWRMAQQGDDTRRG